jgi:hypothetical protein
VDETMTMIITLAQELVVLRERLDAVEHIAAAHGIPLADEIAHFTPDEALLARRETDRQAFYERLFLYAKQRRVELEEQYTEEDYLKTLADIAVGA